MVIIFNDAEMAYTVLQKCFLGEGQQSQQQVHSIDSIWLDTLSESSYGKEAVKAANAEVVVVCLNPDTPLKEGCSEWFRQWARARERDAGTLVAILPENPGSRFDKSRDLLQNVARDSRMEFLSVDWAG